MLRDDDADDQQQAQKSVDPEKIYAKLLASKLSCILHTYIQLSSTFLNTDVFNERV